VAGDAKGVGASMYHERDEDENFMQLGRWTKNCGWTNYFSTLTVKLNSPRAF
jgi:hypothetical protein